MILSEVITRLRGNNTMFGQNVAGSESFFYARDKADSKELPLCIIVPMETVAAPASGNETHQQVTETFATIVVLDNAVRNIRGKDLYPSEQLYQAFEDIKNSLMNWEPAQRPRLDTIRFVRGFHLDMSNARIWHQFDWQTSYFIDNEASYEESNGALIDSTFYTYLKEGLDGTVAVELYKPATPEEGGNCTGPWS